ncbi:MAG: uroporphyrinogen-III synthase [Bacteroidota bacterium]
MNSLLKNKTILVTKSKEEAFKSVSILADYGAALVFFPTIKVVPIFNSPELDEALKMFVNFDYMVFTSSNAVEVFAEIMQRHKLNLSKVKIAAVGKSTAEECESLGLTVTILPDEFSANGLIKKFSEIDIKNKKFFIPGSSLSRGELNMGLSELGAQVFSVPVYDVLQNELSDLKNEHKQIQKKHPNVFVFTSPSAFSNFLTLMNVTDPDKFFDAHIICAIGTTTENAIRKKGLTVHIVPDTFSLNGVSEAIIKYFHITAHVA